MKREPLWLKAASVLLLPVAIIGALLVGLGTMIRGIGTMLMFVPMNKNADLKLLVKSMRR